MSGSGTIATDIKRREELQKTGYGFPADYTPPQTGIQNSVLPTPRKNIEYPYLTQASSTITPGDPASEEMKRHWDDYRNRGIIYNTMEHNYDHNIDGPNAPFYARFSQQQGRDFFNGSLSSDLPKAIEPIFTNIYTKNKKLFKELAYSPRKYENKWGQRLRLYYDYIEPLGGKFAKNETKTHKRNAYVYALLDSAPTYLANKKLEKLGVTERLPYGAGLHPDTFHDIMSISTKKYRQAPNQQAPAPAAQQRAPVLLAAPTPPIDPNPPINPNPPRPGNRVTFANMGDLGIPQRIRHNLAPNIYTLNNQVDLNFVNPYPRAGDIAYPARNTDPKIDQATAQGNLRTYNQIMLRREVNSIADSESALQAQIQLNRLNTVENLKRQTEDVAHGLERTLGPQRLIGLNKKEIAKTLVTPPSLHFMVERGGGFTNPSGDDPRAILGHQQTLEHYKLTKRGEVKLKGFDIVEAPDAAQALQNIAPRRAALRQYIDSANWSSREKEISKIKRNLSKFMDRFNRERYGDPATVHATNAQNISAARRASQYLVRRTAADDNDDLLARILNTARRRF